MTHLLFKDGHSGVVGPAVLSPVAVEAKAEQEHVEVGTAKERVYRASHVAQIHVELVRTC